MAKLQRNFIKGKMNKSLDERLVPNGEYIDALNVRIGSTELSEIGAVENTKGNTKITQLAIMLQTADGPPIAYGSRDITSEAKCIGAYEDSANETIYWFVTDPGQTAPIATGKLDLIVSYNVNNGIVTYHVVSVNDGGNINTTLNFNSQHLITGVDKIDDLLFFTDNYNPPRFIDVTENYPQPGFVGNSVANPYYDWNENGVSTPALLAEKLLVVKKPPINSPTYILEDRGESQNFLEDKFICFAYRYRYENDMYSATSQFTDPAFISKSFNYSPSSYLNEGMVNLFDTVDLTFNTGGPLVVGIDLLFKEASNSVIKIIEKLDKSELGYPDNSDQIYTFSNSKIYSLLGDNEILRLYDNVPLKAKAQTIMGKRIMYGNYTEGYNLGDIRLDYIVDYESFELGKTAISPVFSPGTYTIIGSLPPKTVADAQFSFDLSTLDLKAGSLLEFNILFQHDSFASASLFPTLDQTGATAINFSYLLINDYADAFALFSDIDFRMKIGQSVNIVNPIFTVADGPVCCNNPLGDTFTDVFNCAVPINHSAPAATYTKIDSGIHATGTPMSVEVFVTAPNVLTFQLPAVGYTSNPVTTPSGEVYEYYKATSGVLNFIKRANTASLHSNRDYEVGIIYMDDYNRSSTVLVSSSNIIHIPCSNSITQNIIKVEIPPSQLPPVWATRYKFAIKQDKELYETIYSNIYFYDRITDANYFKLEGENSQKVTEGDTLYVKIDGNGALESCRTVTVLEKKAQEKGFIQVQNSFSGATDLDVPSGVYMKIRNSNITINNTNTMYYDFGKQKSFPTGGPNYVSGLYPFSIKWNPIPSGNGPDVGGPMFYQDVGNYPILLYKGFSYDSNGAAIDPEIPQGTVIKFRIYMYWQNWGAWKKYELNKEFTTTQDHVDIVDWWETEDIANCLGTGNYQEDCGTILTWSCPSHHKKLNEIEYVPYGGPGTSMTGDKHDFRYVGDFWGQSNWIWNHWSDPGPPVYVRWVRQLQDNELIFAIKGNNPIPVGGVDKTVIEARFEILKTGAVMAFETAPQDAAPDIFYESSVSHAIVDKTPLTPNGYHSGNVQTQTATLPALINTQFQNCFTFGNGIESYKIRDSITKNSFGLGNRVSAVLEGEDYREVHRFADITYSGTYGYNINNLNEFNLGLLNFKVLEPSFGDIQKLFARATDILTLQEDKISYVLAGKNLLSDAAAGGVITSVPEVLGTQIARIEEYGIGNNPESFAEYGYDKYFTDSKRGVVIQLKGSAYSNEQLNVISNFGMSSWFRDLFLMAPNTQKLGGFDPYMKEYVLSSNDISLPGYTRIIRGGVAQNRIIEGVTPVSYTVEIGELVGDCTLIYHVKSVTGTYGLTVKYDGVTKISVASLSGTGSSTFTKDKVLPSTATVTITGTGDNDKIDLDIELTTPSTTTLNIIEICISDDNDKRKTIHNEYRWTSGTFVSPLHSNFISLVEGDTAPLISEYRKTTAFQGGGFIPINAATVEIISHKYQSDNFDFDSTLNNFGYLRSSTLYPNTPAGVLNLLNDGSFVSVAGAGSSGVFKGSFAMPSGSANDNLYLVYDYRKPTGPTLCYSNVSADDACCTCGTSAVRYIDGPTLSAAKAVYTTAALDTKAPDGWYAVGGLNRKQVSGLLTPIVDCIACKLACGTTLSMDTNRGYYTIEVELGSATGAVVIDFDFKVIPEGVKVVYNGTTYNDIYSPVFGFINSPGTHPVYSGTTFSGCNVSGITFSALPEYRFNGSGFNLTGTTQNVTVDATSVFLKSKELGSCKMIIPKTAASPTTATITLISPCEKANIDITPACPTALTAFTTTLAAPEATNIAGLCVSVTPTSFYNVPVGGTAGNPGIGDIIYQDANGSTLAGAGFYGVVGYPAGSGVIQVNANGKVETIVACI